MKFGVCAWIYGDAPLEGTLGRIAAAGYDGVELPGEPDRWPAGDPELYVAVGPFGDIDGSPSKALLLERREDKDKSVDPGGARCNGGERNGEGQQDQAKHYCDWVHTVLLIHLPDFGLDFGQNIARNSGRSGYYPLDGCWLGLLAGKPAF